MLPGTHFIHRLGILLDCVFLQVYERLAILTVQFKEIGDRHSVMVENIKLTGLEIDVLYCSDRRDMLLDQCNVSTASEVTIAAQHDTTHMSCPKADTAGAQNLFLDDLIEDDYHDIDSGNQSLAVADLFVIQSSFDGKPISNSTD